MAANVLTTAFFASSLVLLCFLFHFGVCNNIQYEPFKSSHIAILSGSVSALNFDTHQNSRLRRNIGGSVGDGVIADASTNSGANDQTLPDQSNQPVSPATVSDKNTSTTFPGSSTTEVPKITNALPKAENTDKSGESASISDSDTTEEPDIIHDFHNYYTSQIISSKFSEHWIDLENATRHETLSTGHRVAAVISLMFDFFFFGHKVSNVTVATGGFIYMSPFLHQWLTVTQYIAPLMANFDPSFHNHSNIFIQSEKTRFIIEWKNLVLKDQNTTGQFHFQAILNADNTIKFAYKSIPFPVLNISNEEHPVKIGVSDAYYNDTYIPNTNIKRRTIYEYHKVVLSPSAIKSGVVIILNPLPTCNRLMECESCVKHTEISFDCNWCSAVGRCSDGLDWYRQNWDKEGCQKDHTEDVEACSSNLSSIKPFISPDNISSSNAFNTSTKSILDPKYSPLIKDPCLDGKCDKKSDFPIAVVVFIVLICVGILAGIVGWIFYAYKHPTSRSGIWLMEHRPSQIKSKIKFWKSSSDAGTKYKVESEA